MIRTDGVAFFCLQVTDLYKVTASFIGFDSRFDSHLINKTVFKLSHFL